MTKSQRIFDWRAYEATVDARIKRLFSSSFMSNSKWRRLFEELVRPELELSQIIWKLVGREREFRSALPDPAQLTEVLVVDMYFNDFFYKEIEWVELPATAVPLGWEQVPHKHRKQSLERAFEAINAIGQFEVEHREEGLRIYGWR